jgi:hypothetical protein
MAMKRDLRFGGGRFAARALDFFRRGTPVLQGWHSQRPLSRETSSEPLLALLNTINFNQVIRKLPKY